MALVQRVLLSRFLGQVLRSRAVTARPAIPTAITRWTALSVVSHPAWKSCCGVGNRTVLGWAARPLALSQQTRGYGAGAGITIDELKERTVNVLKLFDKVNPEKVTLEAHFMNDLGMDSLDAVEVVMAFEDEFGVEISDEEAEKIFTCNDAVELLKVKLDVH